MEKMRWIKKEISTLLVLSMVLSSVPLPAFAAESDNLCEHHPVHTAECHYTEGSAGSACSHVHSEDCYAVVECLHTHSNECDDPCTHECTVENGCITRLLDCHHVHGDCGYSEGTAEVPCDCAQTDENGAVIHTDGCGYVAPAEGVACGHTEHTDCGYAPATEGTPCTHVCEVKVNSADSCYKLLCSHADGGHDDACGYVAAVEGHECHYECAECAIALANEEPGDETPVCSCTVKCGETVDTNCAVCSAAGADLSAVCNGAEETPVVATDNIDAAAMTPEELKAAVDAALAARYTAITVNLAENADATMFSAITAALAADYVADGTVDLTISGAKTVPECGFFDYGDYFNNDDKNIAGDKLKSLTLTDVETIGKYAFSACTYLESVNLPQVVTIGECAFNEWKKGTKLTSLNLPNATTIGDWAFAYSSLLTSINLPKVTNIGMFAFGYCDLRTLNLPEVTTIDGEAFLNNYNLVSCSAPKATTIDYYPWGNCSKLETLELAAAGDFTLGNNLFANTPTGQINLVLHKDKESQVAQNGDGTATWKTTNSNGGKLEYTFKSITTVHIPEADDGDCTTAVMCSTCGETVVEAKESHTTELAENKATCTTQAVCDLCGTSYGEVDSENHTKDTCTNGFYDCCNAYQPAELVDGVYQIGNAGQLFWFAELVNSGTKNTNAALTADIDLEGRTCTPIAQTASYHASAITDTGYTGIFDGQNHEIRNFTVECVADGEGILSYGLFGTVSGTVKNLGIDNFSFDATATGKADCRAGGIAGQVLSGGRIENCLTVNSSILTGSRIAGGIAGCNYGGTIANCFAYNNTVTGHSRCAAIVGDTVTDSGAPTKLIGYVTNCYADKAPVGSQNGGDTYITSCEQKSAEQFQSGEVAYLLGEAWGQTIGEGLPVLGGEPVKKASDGTYYNDIIQVTIVWTSMEFTYGETWNPETLQYEESWTASGDGAVTVTNEGTMAVNAEFAYAQTYTPVTGSFTQPTLALPPKETETTQLLLSGKPGEDLENQELGTITVTIHRATN